VKRLARRLFERVKEAPDAVQELGALAALLLKSEENELRRQLKGEENAIRRECLEFAKERFRFNVVEEAQRVLPELQELAEARKDPQLAKYEEARRVNGIIRRLFGNNLPEPLHPESPEEEEAMARAEQAREEAKAQEERMAAASRQREQILREREARRAMDSERRRAAAERPASESEEPVEEQPEQESAGHRTAGLTDEEWAQRHPENAPDWRGL
jgi:hypothetical protein